MNKYFFHETLNIFNYEVTKDSCLARREKNIHKRRAVGYSSFWHKGQHPKSAPAVQCKSHLSLDSEMRSGHSPFWPSPAVSWDTQTMQDCFGAPRRTGAISDNRCDVPEGRCPQPNSGVHQDPEGDELKWGGLFKLQEKRRSLWYDFLKTQIRAWVLRQSLKPSSSNTWLLSGFGRSCSALCLPGPPYQKRKFELAFWV